MKTGRPEVDGGNGRGPRPRGLTLPPELVFDGFHSSVLLDEVVDDLGGLLVLQLSLVDAANVKQVLQLRVQVVQLQTHNRPFLSRVTPPAAGTGAAQLG